MLKNDQWIRFIRPRTEFYWRNGYREERTVPSKHYWTTTFIDFLPNTTGIFTDVQLIIGFSNPNGIIRWWDEDLFGFERNLRNFLIRCINNPKILCIIIINDQILKKRRVFIFTYNPIIPITFDGLIGMTFPYLKSFRSEPSVFEIRYNSCSSIATRRESLK